MIDIDRCIVVSDKEKPMVVHSQSEDEDIVHVPVPKSYLGDVYRALADAMGSEVVNGDSVVETLPAAVRRPLQDKPWRQSEIQQLRKLIRTATPQALLDLTTERPGELITFTAVQERSGRTYGQARAELAGLTHLVRTHFGRNNWPVEVTSEGGYVVYYCSSEDIAQWWQSGND